MADCGGITEGVLNSCVTKLVGGVEDVLILLNKSEIASFTRNISNPQIITAISKATGKVGFKYEGKKSSIDAQSDLVLKRYSEGFAHQLVFRIFGNNAAIKKQIALMAQTSLVAVIENKFKGVNGDSAFEIFGIESGLILSAASSNKSDSETQGAWVLTLKTQDDLIEGYPPATLHVEGDGETTGYGLTKVVFNGLLS